MSTSHFPIFHLVSPSCQGPREGQVLPLHPVAPARKSHWALLERGLAPCFRQTKPQKEHGLCSGHTRSCRSRVRLQLLSSGKTTGLVASWQSLTLPSSWTLCLPTSAVYHTGVFGRPTRKIHDLHEAVGRKRPMVGQASASPACFWHWARVVRAGKPSSGVWVSVHDSVSRYSLSKAGGGEDPPGRS